MNQHQSSFLRYAALAVILLGATAVACKPAAQASPGGSGGGNGGSGQGGSGGNSGGGNGGSAGNSTSSPQGGNAGASGGASSRGGSGGATTNVGGASGGSSNGGAGGGNSSNGGAGGASSSNGGASGGNSKGGAGGGSSNNGGAGGGTTTNAGGSTVAKTACVDGTLPADPKMPGYSAADHTKFQTQASGVVTNMSPTEMAQQMRGTDPGAVGNRNWNDIFRQTDNTTRKISGYTFRDGPRGVNLDAPINATSASHSNSTAFPVAMARGATFDTDLEFRIGQAMGDEMVAAKQTMLLAPTVNILRHPLWGRAQETYGEDTFLIGRMGTASVAGIQQYVAACVKHYAGNNIEKQRETDNATMDEQTLREIYARHFEMIIKDGGVACVMAAYNMVNGTKCTQNAHLLTDILRTDFGFQGFVMTDWWALQGGNQGSPSPATGAAAIGAGLDMELPWNWHFDAIDTSGSGVTSTQLQTAAKRILEQKYRFNADQGTALKTSASTLSGGSITNPKTTLAQEAAQKSMVLLKNDNSALPISSSATKIAVLGAKLDYWAPVDASGSPIGNGINNKADDVNNGTIDFANGIRIGDVGSSRVRFDLTKGVSPCQGIKAAAGSATVTCSNSASDAAGKDVVIVVAGLTPYDEGEEYNGSGDRSTFALDGKPNNAGNNTGVQNKLITDAVTAAAGKPVIVVLEGGSVIDMPWLSSVSAVVMAWYPGMVGGTALGQLLFGKANFSGKLPISWPNSLNDLPTFNGGATTAMDYYLGYRYFDNAAKTPLYPFGYGLSYTKFAYSNLVVPCGTVTKPTATTTGGVVNVSVDVTNTGTVAGDEVVFLFVSYPNATKRRSAKELKGFAKVTLAAGAKQTVTIPVRVADLKYWDQAKDSTTKDGSGWLVDSGTVKVMVGGSSATLSLFDTFTVN
jgi:beta-glucosidase